MVPVTEQEALFGLDYSEPNPSGPEEAAVNHDYCSAEGAAAVPVSV